MIRALIIGATVAAAFAAPATATNLVTNGSFEANAAGGVQGLGGVGDSYITGWTIGGSGTSFPLAWYYPVGTADNNGVTAQIYGPGNGVANGFGLSPDGGAMVALDGAATFQASLNQTINGLTAGKGYDVSFYWGGGQQAGFSGTTTEQFHVSLGEERHSTLVWNNPEKGWSGWFHETFHFTAIGPSAVLSFLAEGTPDGEPPFSVLDGVSLTASVPEAATWAMMIVGFGVVGVAARRRRSMVAA
jgi:hypothetical protein